MDEFNIISNIIEFVGGIVEGILSSFAFIVSWEWFKKPSLRFEWLPTDQTTLQVDGRQLRLYHIRVHNHGRSTAKNCYLIIIYRNHRSEPIVTLRPGKWDDNPEPISRDPNNPNYHIFDLSFLHLIGRVTIRAHSSATFCFLIKYEGETPCFGFNADNYRSQDLRCAIDINPETKPDLVADGQKLERIPSRKFGRWRCDPPYNARTAKEMYGTELPRTMELLKAGARVCEVGSLLFLLLGPKNYQWHPSGIKRIGYVNITVVPNNEIRCLNIYYKYENK